MQAGGFPRLNSYPGPDSTLLRLNGQSAIRRVSTQKWLYLFGTLITVGAGTYCYADADINYKDYRNATTDATRLHKRIATEDILCPIAYGLSAACFTLFILKNLQQGKLERKFHFSLAPITRGAAVYLTYDF
jgi:hypothetical protein